MKSPLLASSVPHWFQGIAGSPSDHDTSRHRRSSALYDQHLTRWDARERGRVLPPDVAETFAILSASSPCKLSAGGGRHCRQSGGEHGCELWPRSPIGPLPRLGQCRNHYLAEQLEAAFQIWMRAVLTKERLGDEFKLILPDLANRIDDRHHPSVP